MTKVDNSTYQIVNIPLNWYYLILNEKSKKPDYSVIMILAVLAGSYFNSHVDNQDFIKSFSKEWLELLNDIYKSADEYENTEKHSFFYGMLEKYDFIKNKEVGLLAAFLLSEFFGRLAELSFPNKIFVNKKEILELFNETPQRVRKAIEFLKRILLKDIDFKINKKNIEITFSKEIQDTRAYDLENRTTDGFKPLTDIFSKLQII